MSRLSSVEWAAFLRSAFPELLHHQQTPNPGFHNIGMAMAEMSPSLARNALSILAAQNDYWLRGARETRLKEKYAPWQHIINPRENRAFQWAMKQGDWELGRERIKAETGLKKALQDLQWKMKEGDWRLGEKRLKAETSVKKANQAWERQKLGIQETGKNRRAQLKFLGGQSQDQAKQQRKDIENRYKAAVKEWEQQRIVLGQELQTAVQTLNPGLAQELTQRMEEHLKNFPKIEEFLKSDMVRRPAPRRPVVSFGGGQAMQYTPAYQQAVRERESQSEIWRQALRAAGGDEQKALKLLEEYFTEQGSR